MLYPSGKKNYVFISGIKRVLIFYMYPKANVNVPTGSISSLFEKDFSSISAIALYIFS